MAGILVVREQVHEAIVVGPAVAVALEPGAQAAASIEGYAVGVARTAVLQKMISNPYVVSSRWHSQDQKLLYSARIPAPHV